MTTASHSQGARRASWLAMASVVSLAWVAIGGGTVSAGASHAPGVSAPAEAPSVFTVTKTADTNDGVCNADCSLREAIIAANGAAGLDTIDLGVGAVYSLTIPPALTPTPGDGDLNITDAVTIEGHSSLIGAGGLDRVFNIQGGAFTVTINQLEIVGGAASGFPALGGGILVRNASLILNSVTVSGSSAAHDGGGIAAVGSYDAATATTTLASLTLNNSTVGSNTGLNGGGIVCALCTFTASGSSRITTNSATEDGGGLDVLGNGSIVSLTRDFLQSNTAARGGGMAVPFGTSASTLSRSVIRSNVGATGSAIFNNIGTITATNNWWGCSYGPGAGGGGCAATPNGVSGAVTTAPYLVLKAAAKPLAVQVGAPTTVTADLTFNSASIDTSAGGTVPDGVPAVFADATALGTFATPSATTVSGKAVDVYTAGGATGAAAISASVDAQTASTTVTIIVSPTVDLNGDGTGDVFTYNPVTGAWERLGTQPGGGFVSTPGTWNPGWTVVPAAFNADTLTDFFLFSATSGQWFKMLNNGTGFTAQSMGTWWPGWQRFVLDLDGDGLSDVFLYDPSTGNWFKALSTPTGFTYLQGGWNPNWEIIPMRLNNDALGDMFLINRTTGRWFWVLGAAGAAFTYPSTDAWYPSWKLYPGDFNGDGLTDLLLHDPPTGSYFVAMNNGLGTGFSYTSGGWSLGWTPYVGDLDADGDQDLLLHSASTGQFFEMLSDGLGVFTAAGSQTWSLGWNIYPTDLNGDRRTDFLLYHPTTGVWYQARNLSLGTFTYSMGNWAADLSIVVRTPFY